MRVIDVRRMTDAAHRRRKLDVDGNPIVGKRYWYRDDLEEKKPITLAPVPKTKYHDLGVAIVAKPRVEENKGD